MIVVDTNIVAYAALPGRWSNLALAALERHPEWVAPPLWRSEFRNVLATAMRTRGMKLSDAVAAFEAAHELVFDADVQLSSERILTLTARAGISAYEAEFVATAEELNVTLLTGDRRLAKAFPGVAVPLEALP